MIQYQYINQIEYQCYLLKNVVLKDKYSILKKAAFKKLPVPNKF